MTIALKAIGLTTKLLWSKNTKIYAFFTIVVVILFQVQSTVLARVLGTATFLMSSKLTPQPNRHIQRKLAQMPKRSCESTCAYISSAFRPQSRVWVSRARAGSDMVLQLGVARQCTRTRISKVISEHGSIMWQYFQLLSWMEFIRDNLSAKQNK